jgi:hypothetical protein
VSGFSEVGGITAVAATRPSRAKVTDTVEKVARYVAETFRGKAHAESWELEMERRIDRSQDYGLLLRRTRVRVDEPA